MITRQANVMVAVLAKELASCGLYPPIPHPEGIHCHFPCRMYRGI